MKVGTICKLKVPMLGNETGTLGVVFNDYGDGVQVIFENGNYDGFSSKVRMGGSGADPMRDSETLAFLEEIGFEESLAGYQFKNVMQVAEDFRKGLFNITWKAQIKMYDVEKCEVYADESPAHWLRFKRKGMGSVFTMCLLSAATDYEDFSHFEYTDPRHPGKVVTSALPRWLRSKEVTLYPAFVVFHRKS